MEESSVVKSKVVQIIKSKKKKKVKMKLVGKLILDNRIKGINKII